MNRVIMLVLLLCLTSGCSLWIYRGTSLATYEDGFQRGVTASYRLDYREGENFAYIMAEANEWCWPSKAQIVGEKIMGEKGNKSDPPYKYLDIRCTSPFPGDIIK